MDCLEASSKWRLTQFETVERLAHRQLEIRAGVDVVVPGPRDRAVEYQVLNVAPKRVCTFARHDLVALAGQDRDRDRIGFERLDGLDFMIEERTT